MMFLINFTGKKKSKVFIFSLLHSVTYITVSHLALFDFV